MEINEQGHMTETETVTIRSSVLPGLMKQALFRGTLLAAVGAIGILLAGVFLPLEEMKLLGPLIFICGLAMITLGLLPYKLLKRLEEKPSVITIDGENSLHYSVKGKNIFSIPISSIDHISYVEQKNTYGIAVHLKNPLSKKVKVLEPYFNMSRFQHLSEKKYGCDLFLPYFSRRSFSSLQEYLD